MMKMNMRKWIVCVSVERMHSVSIHTTAVLIATTWMFGHASFLYADRFDFLAFSERENYSAVVLQQGRVQLDADWNESQPGDIMDGDEFAGFHFSFDPGALHLAVVPGIVGGLAVGTQPDGALEGDQGVTLVVTPGAAITAFGVEIAYAPFEGDIEGSVFRLHAGCPDPPCFTAVNPAALSPQGGTFFLGVVARQGNAFEQATIEAMTPRDATGQPVGVVPGWQIVGLSYAVVPEPRTAVLLAAGFVWLLGVREWSPRITRIIANGT